LSLSTIPGFLAEIKPASVQFASTGSQKGVQAAGAWKDMAGGIEGCWI
jgi:hypothetical protein